MSYTRKYVSVIYDDNTQKALREWAISNNLDLTTRYSGTSQKVEDFEVHTTIYYSLNHIHMINRVSKLLPSEAFFEGFDFLGYENDIPVMKIENIGVISQIREFFSGYGIVEEWPSFNPHISLSYARQQINLDTLTKPKFDLIFDRVVVEDIEE
jgi:hypothetical protein